MSLRILQRALEILILESRECSPYTRICCRLGSRPVFDGRGIRFLRGPIFISQSHNLVEFLFSEPQPTFNAGKEFGFIAQMMRDVKQRARSRRIHEDS